MFTYVNESCRLVLISYKYYVTIDNAGILKKLIAIILKLLRLSSILKNINCYHIKINKL